MPPNPAARAAFLALAGLAAATMITQTGINIDRHGGLGPALWSMARFFTLWTNTALVPAALWVALRPDDRRAVSAFAGVALCAVFVGLIYHLLLAARHDPSGIAALTNVLLHGLNPAAAVALWALVVPHGWLRRADPFWWSLFPLTYLAAFLVRGMVTGRYPYFFLSPAELGWPAVVANAAGLLLAFLVAGQALVAFDRYLGRGDRQAQRVE